jgi:hypothetical protein
MIDKLQEWLHRLVVSVPREVAVCEFDCHKAQCRMGDWQRCKRRLNGLSNQPVRRGDRFR